MVRRDGRDGRDGDARRVDDAMTWMPGQSLSVRGEF
jgi:hypothetical protein